MRDVWPARAVAVIAGGGAALFLPSPWQIWGAGFLALFALWVFFWQPQDFFGRLWRQEIRLLAVSLLVGFIYGTLAFQGLPPPESVKDVEVSGVLQDWQKGTDLAVGIFQMDPVAPTKPFGAQGNAFIRTSNHEPRMSIKRERFRLTVYPDNEGDYPGLWQQVRPGDRLAFQANLERPKPSGTPGGFDLRLYYAARGLGGALTARGEPQLITAGQPPLTWGIRARVREVLEGFPGQDAGILQGILFGDASEVPAEVQEVYKATGVLHVFAASGSNVAFVVGLFWGLLFFVPRSGRILGTALALVLYTGLCGGSPPVVRAAIMGEAVLLGRLSRGKVSALRWLLLAAAGLFGQNPVVVRDTGFELSMMAAWGIIVLSPHLARAKFLRRYPAGIRPVVTMTVAAQAATLPILISVFHRFSVVGFAANVLLLFILGGVLELGLLGVLLSFYPPLAAVFFQAGLWLLGLANTALQGLARFPWADAWVLQPGLTFWFVWYGGISVWLLGPERVSFVARVWKRRFLRWIQGFTLPSCFQPLIPVFRFSPHASNASPERLTRAGQALHGLQQYLHSGCRPLASVFRSASHKQLFVLALALALLVHLPQRALEIDFLDVGQGDSILVRTPQGQAILIDAGPKTDRFDAGERIVLPYLLRSRIRKLDALFITHEDTDHIGGALAILDNIPVQWVGVPDVGSRLSEPEWVSGIPPDFWQEAGKVRTFKTGDRIDLGSGVGFEVLAPAEVLAGTRSDPNNNSLVLKLHYQGETVLFSGDMEQEEMEEIARATPQPMETGSSRAAWAADFYKVPHHGSRYSLAKPLLDELKPQAVFISVGKNSFGHPAPEVLAYWAERHIPLYRTDEDGTIRLIMSQEGPQIRVGRQD